MLSIFRANVHLPKGQEPMSVVVPLVYDINLNQTTVAQKEMTPVISVSNQQLARLASSGQLNMQRCTIFPSVQVSSGNILRLPIDKCDRFYYVTVPKKAKPYLERKRP